jgi:hypothetical protein
MSPEVIPLLIGALTVFVGTTIVFGHRHADKKDNFDEKPKIDELNDIRMRMRSDATMSSLDAIWRFLDREMKAKIEESKVRIEDLKVDILFYDTTTRGYFNRLINDLERTFRDSMNVRNVWDNLRCKYEQMGKVLYLFGAIEALVGYPLIAVIALNSFLTIEQYYLWGISLFIVAIIFIGLIIYIQRKISHNSKIYDEIKNKYLIDEVRIGN